MSARMKLFKRGYKFLFAWSKSYVYTSSAATEILGIFSYFLCLSFYSQLLEVQFKLVLWWLPNLMLPHLRGDSGQQSIERVSFTDKHKISVWSSLQILYLKNYSEIWLELWTAHYFHFNSVLEDSAQGFARVQSSESPLWLWELYNKT